MSSSLQPVQAAVQALRKAATKGKTKKSVLESIDNVSSSTVLLNSSAPSVHAFDKLVSVFRAPLVPLYSNYTVPSLNVASAVLKLVLNDCIWPCILGGDGQDNERQMGWERVAHSLLSGVIDFLESDNNKKNKTSIAKAFYPPICDFFFKDVPSKAEIGPNLLCTAYMLLSDAATLHSDNQARLRDQMLLGGHALGLAISKTRDFAVLETLLNLFAILLPSVSTSKEKYKTFIRDVFSDWGKEIAELLNRVSTKEWDETATKVIDILSTSDISFPQPFDVDEVVVCSIKYPQPEVSDRFYIDRMSFFVNIQQEDGMYESLQVAYTDVREIKIASAGEKTTAVSMTLKTIPKIGDQALTTKGESLTLFVEILSSDIPRFKEALRHRNLCGAIVGTKRPRVSISESALLVFDEEGIQWEEVPQLPSLKAKTVESVYESESLQGLTDEKPQTAEDKVLHNIMSIAKVADAPLVKVASNISGGLSRPSAKPKLNASTFEGTCEHPSDIDEAENSPALGIKARSIKVGKMIPASLAASNPPQVIVLSDHESEAEFMPASRRSKVSKKRPQRRIDTDEGDATEESKSEPAPEETETRSVEGAYSTKAPESNKVPNAASRSKGTAVLRQKVETASMSDKGKTSTGRAQRAAAAIASAKLAATFVDSEDTNAIKAPHDDDLSPPLFSAQNVIEDTLESADASPTAKKPSAKTAKKSQLEKRSMRTPVPLETVPRSSSPISKISRMKAKKPPIEAKSENTRARKRTTDQTFAAEEQKLSLRKKPRVDIQNVHEDENDEDNLNADHPRIDPSHLPQKYGHRGQKTKASSVLQKVTVDWDQVPSEASVAIKAKQGEQTLPIVLKKTVSVKTTTKKENIAKPRDASKVISFIGQKSVGPAFGEPKEKTRPRVRAPLQTISQVPNDTLKEPELDVHQEDPTLVKAPVSKKLRDRQPANAAPAKSIKPKESILPSLEDTLLTSAIVENVEVEQAKTTGVDDEIVSNDNDDTDNDFQFGQAEEFSIVPITDADSGLVSRGKDQADEADEHATARQDEPRTPLPKKKTMEPLPILNTFIDQQSKTALDLDVEMIDLTDEDVKEALQSLRARREVGKTTCFQDSTQKSAVAYDERESSLAETDAPGLHEVFSRTKVKFDEKLRYKSASLESLTGQELPEPRNVGTSAMDSLRERDLLPNLVSAGRNHRLSGSKPSARVLGPTESTSRKRQENQMKKEPGMEEIVNVLDAIQDIVVANIASKSRTVRGDIRAARDLLIHEAVTDLYEMREESVGHYNNLFALENEYANINRKLVTGFETATNVNADICKFVRQTINYHDRGSLSKKMPQSLFNSTLPQSLLKFT